MDSGQTISPVIRSVLIYFVIIFGSSSYTISPTGVVLLSLYAITWTITVVWTYGLALLAGPKRSFTLGWGHNSVSETIVIRCSSRFNVLTLAHPCMSVCQTCLPIETGNLHDHGCCITMGAESLLGHSCATMGREVTVRKQFCTISNHISTRLS